MHAQEPLASLMCTMPWYNDDFCWMWVKRVEFITNKQKNVKNLLKIFKQYDKVKNNNASSFNEFFFALAFFVAKARKKRKKEKYKREREKMWVNPMKGGGVVRCWKSRAREVTLHWELECHAIHIRCKSHAARRAAQRQSDSAKKTPSKTKQKNLLILLLFFDLELIAIFCLMLLCYAIISSSKFMQPRAHWVTRYLELFTHYRGHQATIINLALMSVHISY